MSAGSLYLCIIQKTAYKLKRHLLVLLFLSTFAMLRKASSCLFVCLFVRPFARKNSATT